VVVCSSVAVHVTALTPRVGGTNYNSCRAMRISILWMLLSVAAWPARGLELVTVAQLEQRLAARQPSDAAKPMQALRDYQLSELLGSLELTERLSDARRARIEQKLQTGTQGKQALQLLADRSAFLDPPADELPALPAPDAETQKRLIASAGSNVLKNLKRLPNFFATRTTVHYSGVPVDMNRNSLGMRVGMYSEGEASREITFRDGEEVIDPMKAKPADEVVEAGFETWGEFGPEPLVILMDAARSTIEFNHWENASTGVVAVFHFSVPRIGSHYEVHYKCPTTEPFHDNPAYHGSFSIDPATGALMRITLETESQPGDPITHVASVIEYSPMVIGERSYVCPVRSLATAVEEVGACAAKHRNPKLDQPVLMLNESSFTDYHRLGSTARILGNSTDTPAAPDEKHQ